MLVAACLTALLGAAVPRGDGAPSVPAAGGSAATAVGTASTAAGGSESTAAGGTAPTAWSHDTLQRGTSLLVAGAGFAGILDANREGFVSLEFRYVAGERHISPWLVMEATEHDQFAGFGAFLDLPFARRWVFTPSLGASIYSQRNGLKLGYHVEFRSTAELTARVRRGRVGASFGHYSNARLGEDNPGTEFLKVLWVIPIGHEPGRPVRTARRTP